MSNKLIQNIKRLSAPFAEDDIEWVVTFTANQTSYDEVILGVAPYIKRESIMDRLDTVFGPTNWANHMKPADIGLYQGIELMGEDGASIIKWDGAAIHVDGNDGIDTIKSVSTQSFRRTAELFGVGRYLKSLPVMFARKQDPSDYTAENNTYVSKLKAKVRWNPPPIPPEYLPDYMTPEQWKLMQQLQRHFEGDERDKIVAILDTWEGDYKSFSYQEAVTNIHRILSQVKTNQKYVKANAVNRGSNQKQPQPPPPPPPPAEPGQAPPAAKKTKQSGVSEKYKKNFKMLQKMIQECKKEDPHAVSLNGDLEAIEKAIADSISNAKPFPPKDLINYIKLVQGWKDLLDEDLPF